MNHRNYGSALFKRYSAHANPDGQAPDVYRDAGPIAEAMRGHWDAVGSHVAAAVAQAVNDAASRVELDDFARLTKAERERLVAAVMADLDRTIR
jgi:hypothetical protein